VTRLNDTEREIARGVHARPSVDGHYWDAATAAIADRDDLLDAIAALEEVWEALAETAPHFSCGEMETLLDLLHLAGHDKLEAVVRWHHAQSDEEEDYDSHLALIGTEAPR